MRSLTGFPDPAAVAEALSLKRGATVRHGLDVLDSNDNPTGETLGFEPTGSHVDWTYRAPDRVAGQSDAVAAVRRQATLTLVGDVSVNLNAARLLTWTEWLLLDGSWARFPLGVFLVVNPGAVIDDGVTVRRTVQCADKSYRWSNDMLDDPLVVPAGTVIVDWVKADLTSRYGETRFAIPSSSATLATQRVFEAGTSRLDVYSRLLEAAGFDQLTASETGRPATVSLAALAGKGQEHVYGAGQGKVLTAGQVEPLLPTLPNVVRFSARQGPSLGNVEGNGLRTVRNQSTGPASIDARGGEEVVLRVEVDAENQPVLDEVAYADAQRYFAGGGQRFTGQVALNPRHSDRDVIGLELPRLGLSGATWNVTSWRYPLANLSDSSGALMQMTCERRVTTS
jgi:hypothetical protein